VIFADSAYGRNNLPECVKSAFGCLLQTVLRPAEMKGFVVLPKRWIAERTFGWLPAAQQGLRAQYRVERANDLYRHEPYDGPVTCSPENLIDRRTLKTARLVHCGSELVVSHKKASVVSSEWTANKSDQVTRGFLLTRLPSISWPTSTRGSRDPSSSLSGDSYRPLVSRLC
jgi:hypothetical protein